MKPEIFNGEGHWPTVVYRQPRRRHPLIDLAELALRIHNRQIGS
jgi:hypothetical protein